MGKKPVNLQDVHEENYQDIPALQVTPPPSLSFLVFFQLHLLPMP